MGEIGAHQKIELLACEKSGMESIFMKLHLRGFVQGFKNRFSLAWKNKWWGLIFALMAIVIGFSIRRIIIYWPSDFSGWGQVIIETLTLPIIAYELYRIRALC